MPDPDFPIRNRRRALDRGFARARYRPLVARPPACGRAARSARHRLDRAYDRARLSRYYTIGHSTHELEHFIELLRGAGARHVVDVRTMPRSRTNPQFNADVLPVALAKADIGYEHIAALGGLRSRQRSVRQAANAYWENASFHNYADYAMGDAFAGGLARLRELGAQAPTAVMCAEALWWRCHRRIIADYLIARGEAVAHIMADGSVVEARLTAAARREGNVLIFPRQA